MKSRAFLKLETYTINLKLVSKFVDEA